MQFSHLHHSLHSMGIVEIYKRHFLHFIIFTMLWPVLTIVTHTHTHRHTNTHTHTHTHIHYTNTCAQPRIHINRQTHAHVRTHTHTHTHTQTNTQTETDKPLAIGESCRFAAKTEYAFVFSLVWLEWKQTCWLDAFTYLFLEKKQIFCASGFHLFIPNSMFTRTPVYSLNIIKTIVSNSNSGRILSDSLSALYNKYP